MSARRTEKERVSAKYASNTSKIRRTAAILKQLPARRSLGAVISDRRLELGIIQSELASAVNLEASMVAKIEDGSRFPDVKYLPGLAKALRIDLVALWLCFIRQRCPEVHDAIVNRLDVEGPDFLRKLDTLPRPLRKTVTDMVHALYMEEISGQKSA